MTLENRAPGGPRSGGPSIPNGPNGPAIPNGSAGRDGLFREEALRHHFSRSRHGELIEVVPAWVRAGFWVLLVCGSGAIVAAVLAWRAGWTLR